MERDDLERMHTWLNDPAVVRWWEGADVSRAGVQARYFDESPAWVEHWIAMMDGDAIGWANCYLASHATDGEAYYWQPHLDLTRTGGIDYLIGAGAHRGRGIGNAMIRAFTRDIVFGRHPEWAFAAAGPFQANAASCRALEKAGFRELALLEDHDGPCRLMAARREDVLRARASPAPARRSAGCDRGP